MGNADRARALVAGADESFPHLAAIQSAFGKHDASGLRAVTGDDAAAIGAEMGTPAFSVDGASAFSGAPTLHEAAHEAAHAYLQLEGREGSGSDAEAHAQAVADRVVAGQSVEALLDQGPSGGGGGGVQAYTSVSGKPYDRVADDGRLAVKDLTTEAWARSSDIAASNRVLDKQNSKARIEEHGGSETVKAPGKRSAKPVTLKKIRMVNRVGGGETNLADDCGSAAQEMMGSDTAGHMSFVAANKRGTTQEFTGPSSYHGDDNAKGGIVSTTEKLSGEIYIRIFAREFKKTLTRVEALEAWSKLSTSQQERFEKKYGINEHAVPRIGQGITIGSERDMPGASEKGYNFHFSLNLIPSGKDYLAVEDFDSSGVKYKFSLYGPASKGQSFHDEWAGSRIDSETTSMVVSHAEMIKGEVNKAGARLVDDPAKGDNVRLLSKGTKVQIIRHGHSWMKVLVLDGPQKDQQGWILNRFFTDS